MKVNDLLFVLVVLTVLFVFARDCAFEAAPGPDIPTDAATRGRSP
jgi:hypothetical protein